MASICVSSVADVSSVSSVADVSSVSSAADVSDVSSVSSVAGIADVSSVAGISSPLITGRSRHMADSHITRLLITRMIH